MTDESQSKDTNYLDGFDAGKSYGAREALERVRHILICLIETANIQAGNSEYWTGKKEAYIELLQLHIAQEMGKLYVSVRER